MAELDPRFGPAEQNCNVTREYLDELYGKADELRLLKRYLAALAADPDFACSIGGFDEWLSRNSSSRLTSRNGSQRSVVDRTTASSRCEQPPRPARSDLLTDRELEIVLLMSDGLMNAEIATRLFLSPYTVQTHAKHIFCALGARSRAHAVAIALRSGLIE